MLRMYQAIPNYLGGKRRLASKILSLAKGSTFADAFMGAGSIALTAKALGFKVYANDLARSCVPIGKGILENDDITLDRMDAVRLLQPALDAPKYWRLKDLTYTRVAEICDIAMHNVKELEDKKKQYLAQAALIRYLVMASPFGSLTKQAAIRALDNGTFQLAGDDRSFQRSWLHGVTPLRAFLHVCNLVNFGVFRGLEPAEFSSMDAFEFLEKIKADTVYLDPPYYGTTPYSHQYKALEEWFGKEDPRIHRFNQENLYERLVEAAQDFPCIIISYGGSTSKDDALKIARKYRKDARSIPIRHRHFRSTRPGRGGYFGNEILIHCPGS